MIFTRPPRKIHGNRVPAFESEKGRALPPKKVSMAGRVEGFVSRNFSLAAADAIQARRAQRTGSPPLTLSLSRLRPLEFLNVRRS